jgi:hypothetical protein
MKRAPTVRLLLIAGALFLALAGAAGAQSILVAVQERLDGTPLEPPFEVGDALTDELYDAGYIVFVPGPEGANASIARLGDLAREGSGNLLLLLGVDWASLTPGGENAGFRAHAAWALLAVRSTSTPEIAHGTWDATNQGREKTVPKSALSTQIGKKVADQVGAALDGSPSSP